MMARTKFFPTSYKKEICELVLLNSTACSAYVTGLRGAE